MFYWIQNYQFAKTTVLLWVVFVFCGLSWRRKCRSSLKQTDIDQTEHRNECGPVTDIFTGSAPRHCPCLRHRGTIQCLPTSYQSLAVNNLNKMVWYNFNLNVHLAVVWHFLFSYVTLVWCLSDIFFGFPLFWKHLAPGLFAMPRGKHMDGSCVAPATFDVITKQVPFTHLSEWICMMGIMEVTPTYCLCLILVCQSCP